MVLEGTDIRRHSLAKGGSVVPNQRFSVYNGSASKKGEFYKSTPAFLLQFGPWIFDLGAKATV